MAFIILLIIGSLVFTAHTEQANDWEIGRVTIGGQSLGNLTETTSRSCADPGEINCNARICSFAVVEGEGLVPVRIQFPAPPRDLNLKNRSTVDNWLRTHTGIPGLDIQVNIDGGPDRSCTYLVDATLTAKQSLFLNKLIFKGRNITDQQLDILYGNVTLIDANTTIFMQEEGLLRMDAYQAVTRPIFQTPWIWVIVFFGFVACCGFPCFILWGISKGLFD